MAFYEELNGIVNNCVSMMMANQDLCKLLYYYPKEIDYKYDPLAEEDIANPRELLMNHLYPLPKIPDAETEQICFVNVTVCGGDKMEVNKGFRKVLICFDIICHLDAWIIKNGYRPMKIMSEIDKMLNYQTTTLNIVNKPVSLPFIPKDYSNKFYGYRICYELQLNSNISCGV